MAKDAAAAGGDAGKPSALDSKPRPRGSFLTIMLMLLALFVMMDPRMRNTLANVVGVVLDPLIGFNGKYPVLTILLAGTLMVGLTTVVRHFLTDWLEMARNQAYMRHFQKEFSKARKENNTYRMKKLQDAQPEMMKRTQEMQTKSFKQMPYTMILVIPLFAWVFNFLSRLDYWFYSAPWNATVDMFGVSALIFPHWMLLYMCLSIPLGSLLGRALKYLSWKERWQKQHPEVHEG